MNTTIQSSPGIVTKVYPYPGYCATILQESHNSGEGYEDLTELPKVPGIVA